jgi:hypothetical protein
MQDAVLIDGCGTIYHNKIMGIRKHSKDIKKFCLVQIGLPFSGRKE